MGKGKCADARQQWRRLARGVPPSAAKAGCCNGDIESVKTIRGIMNGRLLAGNVQQSENGGGDCTDNRVASTTVPVPELRFRPDYNWHGKPDNSRINQTKPAESDRGKGATGDVMNTLLPRRNT
ncbi:hypothetical protein J6590_001968 [Homalodisca vitripennis]|nr:hypothetical protein J6590_001968 [Homalodisca vitripennis]